MFTPTGTPPPAPPFVLPKEVADTLTAISAALSAIAATVTIFIAWVVFKGQERLSMIVFQGQQRLSQRQLLIPLWAYMEKVRSINLEKPSSAQILSVANTLELVAVSVEGQMVDEDVIRRTFDDVFMGVYQQIDGLTTVPGYTLNNGQPMSGKIFLNGFPAAERYFAKRSAERVDRHLPPPLN